MMIETLLATAITFSFTPIPVSPTIANFCADAVGIPRNSDNFTDAEYKQFKSCVIFHNK
jgi:hypothetical protein